MSEETVAIERLAAGGDGVGHLADGVTVFVPRTAPGDVVRLTGIVRRRRHAFARVAELLTASAGRVAKAFDFHQDRHDFDDTRRMFPTQPKSCLKPGSNELQKKRRPASQAATRLAGRRCWLNA